MRKLIQLLAMGMVMWLGARGYGQGFTNSLGMKFVPVPGTDVLFCTTEVTVDQYKAAGMGYRAPKFPQRGDHPAVNVRWEDARKFCKWLSKRDGRKYRLPSDHEWSCAVGIGHLENPRATPESKNAKIKDVYPWGKGNPSGKAGNYMGQEWRRNEKIGREYFPSANPGEIGLFPGYDDGVLFTAPVGSFAPNRLGIYDLGGNVCEWCEDKYGSRGPNGSSRVLRGGSWGYYGRNDANLLSSLRYIRYRDSLLSSFRYVHEFHSDYNGFRVVCETGSGR